MNPGRSLHRAIAEYYLTMAKSTSDPAPFIERCTEILNSGQTDRQDREAEAKADVSTGHCAHNEARGVLTVRLDAELTATPEGFREASRDAEQIDLVIGAGCGGCSAAAFEIIDAMDASPAATTATILNYASSSHALIFLAADKRTMRKDARIMLHGPTMAAYGTAFEMNRALHMLDECTGRMHDLLNDRTPLPADIIDRLLHSGHDYWFSADECAALGLAGFTGAASS